MTTKETIPPKESASSGASAEDQLRVEMTADIIAHFRAAMHQSGINYSGEIVPDGHVRGAYLDGSAPGIYCGIYGLSLTGTTFGYARDFSQPGVELRWKYTGKAQLPPAHAGNRQQPEKITAAECKRRAFWYEVNYLWSISKPAVSHPYLERMGIKAYGARSAGDDLIIPAYACQYSPISAVQLIKPDGSKRLIDGGNKARHFTIGKRTKHTYVCVDFATGAALHEKTGQKVLVAFLTENLYPVSRHAQSNPSTFGQVIVAGDNSKDGKSQKAAHSATYFSAQVYIPASVGTWHDHRDSIVGPSL